MNKLVRVTPNSQGLTPLASGAMGDAVPAAMALALPLFGATFFAILRPHCSLYPGAFIWRGGARVKKLKHEDVEISDSIGTCDFLVFFPLDLIRSVT